MTEYIKTISDKAFSVLMRKVYMWTSFALLIKGGIPYLVAFVPNVISTVITNQFLFYGVLITELVLVVWISAALHKMSSLQATAIIIFYTYLNGVTSLSILLMIYTDQSLTTAFFIAFGTCAVMYLWGNTTKANLSTMGELCTMGLIGLVLATIVNFFLNNEFLMIILNYIGVIVFVGLTAYDTQKTKTMLCQAEGHDEDFEKLALMSASTFCLNWFSLIIYMLSILSRYDSYTNFTTSL